MSVSISAVLMMLRGAFLAAELAYPPHAATCSSAGGGVVAIYGGGSQAWQGGLSHHGASKS